jgi:hypothetical protein
VHCGLRTARYIAYRAVNWPAAIALNGVNYRLKALGSAGPGLVYELAAPGAGAFPHVTIHDIITTRAPGTWKLQGQDYQVVLGPGAINTYPHQANAYQPFPGNPAAPTAAATLLATAFWATF